MSVESFEANGALRMLAEFHAVHASLRLFTNGLLGRDWFGSDVELLAAVTTEAEGVGIRITSYHRFGMLIDGGPDLNELSISCGLLVGESEFSSSVTIEAFFDTPAGTLPKGQTSLLSERASSESLHEALKCFSEHAELVTRSPEVFSRLNL